MFQKILVANRGEIACRVMKTIRQMGLTSVAVYSEVDRDALHVSMADEAVCIGPASSNESYLNIERILGVCRETNAEAVHPGYGFLSENATFAERLDEAGIVFIGPSPHAIRSMGDKITSKRLATDAGVSTVPGFADVIENSEHAVEVAREVGYPVMLKASAGGGGKGMRIARNDAECRDGFERAASEAGAAFGDSRVFLERFIESPRHIEIQVLGDRHGNVIHLFERECSLQRRHQKIIEESPSPFLDDETRHAMGNQAVALARAVEYHSAGTVEFIVDEDRNFYFLEMNTRLQVEHPVTEYVTGLDLVELMIRVAAGEELPLTQTDVRQQGSAIESRIYAEDPLRNFLPSIGRLVRYSPPPETDVVRVDSGVYEGAEISMFYDPMIAKLVTYGSTRQQSIEQMRDALNRFYISGVSHNIGFLAALIEHPRFREGRISTNMIAEEYPEGFQPQNEVHDAPSLLIVTAAAIHRRYMDRAARISGQLPGYEREVPTDWVVVMNGEFYSVEVHAMENGSGCIVHFDDETYQVQSDWQFGQPLFEGSINGNNICLIVERRNMTYRLLHWGSQVDLMVLSAKAAELLRRMPAKAPPDTSRFLLSPMPGLLSQLLVEPTQEVKRGQDLAVVEAMKMENVLRSERDAVVKGLLVEVGETLSVDQPILEFEGR